jgi:hypothetical protein
MGGLLGKAEYSPLKILSQLRHLLKQPRSPDSGSASVKLQSQRTLVAFERGD